MLACLSELTLILGQGTMSSVSTRPTCLCPVCPRGATYLPCQHWLGRLASSWPLQGHLLMVTSPLSTFYTANILSEKGTGCTGNSKVNTQEEEEEEVEGGAGKEGSGSWQSSVFMTDPFNANFHKPKRCTQGKHCYLTQGYAAGQTNGKQTLAAKRLCFPKCTFTRLKVLKALVLLKIFADLIFVKKNLHDPIFGHKNFTHWKHVNHDHFRQQISSVKARY